MKERKLALMFTLLVLITTLAVSLEHLAAGIAITTGIATWESWAMAIVIDAGMVAAEYAALVDRPTRYTRSSVILGLVLSAIFNCIAFTVRASMPSAIIGIVLGVLVPTSLYISTQIAHTLRRPKRKEMRTTRRRKASVSVLKTGS